MNADWKTGGPVDLLRIQKTTSFKRQLINSRDPQTAALISRSLSLVAQTSRFLQFSLEGGTLSATTSTPSLLLHSIRVLLLLINGYAIRNDILVVVYIQGFSDSSLNTNLALCSFNSRAEI